MPDEYRNYITILDADEFMKRFSVDSVYRDVVRAWFNSLTNPEETHHDRSVDSGPSAPSA